MLDLTPLPHTNIFSAVCATGLEIGFAHLRCYISCTKHIQDAELKLGGTQKAYHCTAVTQKSNVRLWGNSRKRRSEAVLDLTPTFSHELFFNPPFLWCRETMRKRSHSHFRIVSCTTKSLVSSLEPPEARQSQVPRREEELW